MLIFYKLSGIIITVGTLKNRTPKGGKMKVDWQRLASMGICLTLGLFFMFLLGKYVVAVFLPFLIAWLMALLANSISKSVYRHLGLPRKLCSAIVLILLFAVIGALLFWGVNRFITEIENFISRLTADKDSLSQSVSVLVGRFDDIGSNLPLLREFKDHEQLSSLGEQIDEMLSSFLKGLASDIGTALTTFAAAAMRALPSIMLFVIISIIASFYFTLDFEAINGWILRILPEKIRARIPRLKQQTKSLAARYLKAYSILMVLTFFEVFVGLSVIGVDYAFLLALGISFLDILPIFGVGTVLIPWAVFSFFTHNFSRGIGLVILWAIVTVIRQIAEPKIVGETIGLHPIVTLIGMYVGFRLFGIVGMFLAPAAIIAVRAYFGGKYIDIQNSAIDSAPKK